MKIFGYGSNVGSSGMNNHGLKQVFKPEDFKEDHLTGYKRDLNVHADGHNFFGIKPSEGDKINGVIVDVKPEDVKKLVKDEESKHSYVLKDVTDSIIGKHPERIHTFVSNPEKDKIQLHQKAVTISPHYRREVKQALIERSPKFQREFEKSTSPKGILSNPEREQ